MQLQAKQRAVARLELTTDPGIGATSVSFPKSNMSQTVSITDVLENARAGSLQNAGSLADDLRRIREKTRDFGRNSVSGSINKSEAAGENLAPKTEMLWTANTLVTDAVDGAHSPLGLSDNQREMADDDDDDDDMFGYEEGVNHLKPVKDSRTIEHQDALKIIEKQVSKFATEARQQGMPEAEILLRCDDKRIHLIKVTAANSCAQSSCS